MGQFSFGRQRYHAAAVPEPLKWATPKYNACRKFGGAGSTTERVLTFRSLTGAWTVPNSGVFGTQAEATFHKKCGIPIRENRLSLQQRVPACFKLSLHRF